MILQLSTVQYCTVRFLTFMFVEKKINFVNEFQTFKILKDKTICNVEVTVEAFLKFYS